MVSSSYKLRLGQTLYHYPSEKDVVISIFIPRKIHYNVILTGCQHKVNCG